MNSTSSTGARRETAYMVRQEECASAQLKILLAKYAIFCIAKFQQMFQWYYSEMISAIFSKNQFRILALFVSNAVFCWVCFKCHYSVGFVSNAIILKWFLCRLRQKSIQNNGIWNFPLRIWYPGNFMRSKVRDKMPTIMSNPTNHIKLVYWMFYCNTEMVYWKCRLVSKI